MYSFVVPTYNDTRIYTALDSFIAAEMSHECECIVVLNQSPKDYQEKLTAAYLNHKNIRFLCINEKNISLARNVAILHAKFDYVVMLDSDCHIPKDYINRAKQYTNDADVVMGKVIFENNDSKLTQQYNVLRSLWYEFPKRLYSPNLIVRKTIYYRYGLYDPELSGCEDSEWSERILRQNTNITVRRASDVVMYHQPDNVPKLYKTWMRYGRLRSYLAFSDMYINKTSKVKILTQYFKKGEHYRLSHGVTFFLVLYAYRFFRLIGSLREFWRLRKVPKSYFVNRPEYLKSEEFIQYNLQLVTKET